MDITVCLLGAALGLLVADLAAVPPARAPTTVKPGGSPPATYRPKLTHPQKPATYKPRLVQPSRPATYQPSTRKPGQGSTNPPIYKPGGATYPIPDR